MAAVAHVTDNGVSTVEPSFATFEDFIAEASVRLRRAFVARYGVEIGVEACSDAVAWACAHQTRLMGMANPIGYLYRVGQTSVRSQVRWMRAPLFPAEATESELPLPDGGLHVALSKLTRDQRSAVMLVHAHGYRYAEAAALLDIPISTLKNHLNRGLARLRRLLEHES